MAAHLVIYTDDPDKGGVAQYNHQIALFLAEAGFKVSIVQTASQSWRVREQARRGIHHAFIDYDTGKEFGRTLVDTADAERAFGALQPTLILFSDCCPLSNLAAKQVAIRLRIPYVVTVNYVADYLAERFSNCLAVLRDSYARSAAVIAVSTENLQLLRRRFGLGRDRGSVVFYGAAPQFFTPRDAGKRAELRRELGIADNTLLSLTAARLTGVKGHVIQIYALALLAAQLPGTRVACVWAGDGELRESLEKEARAQGVLSLIHFVGMQDDVAPWCDAADCFVLTSSSEGMPIAIMEAMAKGLPIAASAVSGIPEEIENSGRLLPSPQADPNGAVTQLARTWHEWFSQPLRRAEIGRKAQVRAEGVFRLDQMGQNTLAVLRQALPGMG